MTASHLTLQLLSGPYELRRKRFGEDDAISPLLHEHDVAHALREAIQTRPLSAFDLLEPLVGLHPSFFARPESMAAALTEALHRGLLVLAKPGAGPRDEMADRAWRAFDAFQAQFGREFNVAARSHRLVGRDQADRLRREADYDVVPAGEAAAIVTRVGKSSTNGRFHDLLAVLVESIVDMRAPANLGGFVLLRAPMTQAERLTAPEEVITPAKLKKLAEDRLKEPRWLAEEPIGNSERRAATASIDDEVYVRVTTSGFPTGTAVTFVIMDGATREVVATLSGQVGDGGTLDMAHALWKVPEFIESGRVVPDKHEFVVSAEAMGQRTEGAILKVVPSLWEILLQFDPDDPQAQDDELILLDAAGNEVERVGPGEMTKQGRDWVVVKFKNTRRLRRYTLIRDHGPDEGCGTDVLFFDMSPDELENEHKQLEQGHAHA